MFLSSLNNKESGLTLLEIIIAIAILSTAGLAVLNLFADNSRLVGRTRERSQALSQARSIMEEIKNIAVNSAGEIDDGDGDMPDDFGDYLREEIEEEYDGSWNSEEEKFSFDDHSDFEMIEIILDEDSDTLYEAIVKVEFADEQEVELASLITAR